jgi:4-hydroxy-tetrahydrodipicolinate synthase
MRFKGIYTPIITPFNDDYSIDIEGYGDIIEHQIAGSVHGIIIGGTTGESYALTEKERLWQFTFAHERIAGRAPWLAGVNAMRTEDVCAFSVAAKDAGADGILLAAPPYSQPTDEELAAHVLEVDRAAGMPAMLYNYPARSGAVMGEEFLERVGRSANICAIKESSGDINRIHMIAREFPHLQLSCGADDQALEFFAWGAESWVCAAGNFFLKEAIGLYEACVIDGNFEKGRRIMKAMLPVMTVLERGGKFVQCVKYACTLDDLPAGAVRLPMQGINDELKQQVSNAVLTAKAAIKPLVEK